MLRLGLQRLARMVPNAVYQRLLRPASIGFCYHLISPKIVPHVSPITPSKTPEMFEADLRYLKQLRSSRRNLPELVMTFDDGLRQVLTEALPLLEKFDFPAIVFLTTNFLDNQELFYRHKIALCLTAMEELDDLTLEAIIKSLPIEQPLSVPLREQFQKFLRLLTWHDESLIDTICRSLNLDIPQYLRDVRPYLTTQEVSELAHHPLITLGAHSCCHVRLRELPTAAEREREIVESCRIVRELAGKPSVPFAFPFSGNGLNRNELADLRSRNPEVGLLYDRRGFQPDANFVRHRIIADSPSTRGTNLPALMNHAYQTALKTHLRSRFPKVKAHSGS